MRVGVVRRKSCFSPNSVEKDAAILNEVVDIVKQFGYIVTRLEEDDVMLLNDTYDDKPLFDIWLSMGRLSSTLEVLKHEQQCGALVVNSAYGVEKCRRDVLQEIMEKAGIPTPDHEGEHGYWIKRADLAAQSHDDVVYAANRNVADELKRHFIERGIEQYVVQAHVVGDVVKFYGVQSTGFFRFFYPGDDKMTKFGDEIVNGAPHHYHFDVDSLKKHAEQLSMLTGVQVYGGDCVVTEDSDYRIIDFNDWPSFSRCRHDAAVAIASLISPDNL